MKDGVLDHALPDLQTLLVQLALQLGPDQLVLTCVSEALPEEPDSGGVRYHIGEPEEPMEADAVAGLAFQLGVAETVPALEHQELHHHHWVNVGASSLGARVVVEGLYLGEPVA